MKNPLLLLATLLCSALIAFGQSSPTAPSASPTAQSPTQSGAQTPGQPANPNAAPGAQSTDPSSASSSTAGSMTVDGCLGGAAPNYTVKDKATGTMYNLTGISSNLDQHVGAEIQVSGTPGDSQNSIHATSMKKVAATCTAGK